MRIWSLHPKYLDSKGLVALWRETLLAQKVLDGKTKGYKNHPQLNRFKAATTPISYISSYLHSVCDEADRRGYNFDRSKILMPQDNSLPPITVTTGQVKYEWQHLLNKLIVRDPKLYEEYKDRLTPALAPQFHQIDGDIEDWEIIFEN
ncbi:MAG: pyrimidine dimer DNA glycosylase/endonuclease V [Emcibacteraceae bacterium]